ncbi:Aste57867_2435 [Aphanomyces stellatus]|uniref:Aste57867_2435 protein n=1 Tax=Aphanomyces stellatus TaxID=120398 RepID=A0A485KA45_9STRA|nr:hypothetical protein As57867_002429 [Aphanomyces stellatus]VFT79636.1 Aste57867_2435 [Aphanomyces stellatus]
MDLEPLKREYWLDPSNVAPMRSFPGNFMKTELGHYLDQHKSVNLVRIKSINLSSSPDTLAELVCEVRILVRVNHPKIVQFIGFSICIRCARASLIALSKPRKFSLQTTTKPS